MIPQIYSPLPYNLDGMTEIRIAQDILDEDKFPTLKNQSYAKAGYMAYTPVYNIFLAYAAQMFGLQPVEIAQIITPIIGAVAVIAVFLLIHTFVRNKLAAIIGSLFLVFSGTFVFVTAAAWKEAMAFALIPIILYMFYRRNMLKYRIGAIILLIFLIFVHHLATIITYLIVTFIVTAQVTYSYRKYRSKKRRIIFLEFATVGVCWLVAASYYHTVRFERFEYLFTGLTAVLLILVIILMMIVVIFAARKSERTIRFKPSYLLPIVAVAFLFINYFFPIFPAFISPNVYLLLSIIPYFVLLAFVIGGATKLLYSTKLSDRSWIAALFIAPITIMLFGVLKKMDFKAYAMFFRSFDFIDYGVAIAIGVGLVTLMMKSKKIDKKIICVCFVALCVATTPIAYSTKQIFGVQNETYFYEYRAVRWLADHNQAEYVLVSDQRISQLGWRLYDIKYSGKLPAIMINNKTLKNGEIYFAESKWWCEGAQIYPHGREIINQTVLMEYVLNNNILYVGGSAENRIYIFTYSDTAVDNK
jgi:hypothetical protein